MGVYCNGKIQRDQERTGHPNYFERPRADVPALDRTQVERPPRSHDDVGGEGDRDKDEARVRK